MNKAIVVLVTLLLVSDIEFKAQGAKILALLNVASPSHNIFNRVLTRALAERGHQVTEIGPDVDEYTSPNLTSITLKGIYKYMRQTVDYEDYIYMSAFQAISSTSSWVENSCENLFQLPGTKKLLNYPEDERFDLIITEASWNECFYGFIHKFGSPPVVATSPFGIDIPLISSIAGTPENPSYIPNCIYPYTDHMSFSERLHNFVARVFWNFVHRYDNIQRQERIARRYFKEDVPSFWEIKKNFSIFLISNIVGLDYPRPMSPNVIPVGGMHIPANTQPLSQTLQKFLDEAKDGFIYFSLGTNLQSSTISKEKRQAILDAFSELPQRVLWKFESENLKGRSPNIEIHKWLPQRDILAHPNIRMFISHCGRLSVTEAVYRGVPVVGMPFSYDQVSNAHNIVTRGVGVKLDYISLTKESVLHAVREVLYNESYRENMKKISQIFREDATTALERAVYWTEYVIRHKGASHLRPASTDLYWHQYLLLDVWAVLISVTLVVIWVKFLLLRAIYRTLRKNLATKDKTN